MGEGRCGVECGEAGKGAGLVRVEKAAGSGEEGETRGSDSLHDFGESFQKNDDSEGGK